MWSPLPKKQIMTSTQEPPISRIIQAIINQALRENVANIQLLPGENEVRVEYFRDNVWFEAMTMPKHMEPAIVAGFKEMAGLPTQYRMVLQGLILHKSTQDGVTKDYDIHLALQPTRYGEKVMMRIEAAEAPE